jgi:hypothetical protein
MKNYKLKHCFILALLFCGLLSALKSAAQFDIKVLKNPRSDAGISYNFFIGDDDDDFATSINGFGSGFIFDILTGRYSIDVFTIGFDKINLGLGAGFAISKYRFKENIIFSKENDIVTYSIDDDPAHDYVNTFFGYGKSKLVYGSFYFPVNLNVSLGDIFFSCGGLIDQYVSGKHKRKFKVDGDKEKIVIRNDEFSEFNLNKTKLGVNAMIMHEKSGIGMGFTYMITPFFKEGEGPALNEVRISLTFKYAKYNKYKGMKDWGKEEALLY